MHLCTSKIEGRQHFTWHKTAPSLSRDSPCFLLGKPQQQHARLPPHNTQPYAECFPGRNFWLERFSPRNGFAWKFKDEACDFKKYHHGFLRRKQKCYFRSLDNKINRWVPTGDICLWQPKATVVAVCHKRPPHSVTVFTVRWFVLICSLKFLPWNFNVAFTSCFHK